MPSRLRETSTGYQIAFSTDAGEEPYLTLDCNYLDQTAWGLMSSVQVSTNIENERSFPNGVILIDRINLLNGKDLRQMAQRIGEVIAPPISGARQDWLRHLEHAAVIIDGEMTKPVPAVDLSERDLPGRQRFDIVGVLAENKTNVLYGPGGTGKSLLATRIACSLASGHSLFGFDTLHQGGTLYLDWEDDADTMVRRLDEVCAGMGLPRLPMAYKSMLGRGPYERHHADVKEYLRSNPGIRLVIFDSTAMAMHGSSQGDGADGAIKFFQMVSQLPATRLLLDHIASEDVKTGTGTPKPYGSVFKTNSARNMWEVVPWNKEAAGSGFTMKHRKTNVGPRMDQKEVAITWHDESVTFEAMTQEEAAWDPNE